MSLSPPEEESPGRNNINNSPLPKGAYFGAPGEELRRAPAFVPANLPPQERQPAPALQLPTADPTSIDTDNKDSLVEAQPVKASDANLLVSGQATEFDPESQENTKTNNPQKLFQYTLLAGFLVLLTVIGVVVATSSTRNNNEQNAPPAPTISPPISPTSSPTASSTSPPLLVENLPNYSLASLEDPFSPQSTAYAWLENHPNITNLEPWRRKQLFALATIYHAFDGKKWPLRLNNDWLDYDKHECDWYSGLLGTFNLSTSAFTYGEVGYACNQHGEYKVLFIEGGADFGYTLSNVTFPAEMGLLTKMERIRLSGNAFVGVATSPHLLPQSFFGLSNLQEFHLGTNQLNTLIPSQLGLLANLESLKLLKNEFYGPIPSQLRMLSKLAYFGLSQNELTGTIPSQLGQLSSLRRMRLNHNQFTGAIPSQLALSLDLRYLDLSYNRLSGIFPSQLGIVPGLGSFALGNNSDLAGTIPGQLCPLLAPNCQYLNANDKIRSCALGFDCSDSLCGCNCECHSVPPLDD